MNNTQHTSHIAEQLSQLRDLLIVIERGGEASPDVLYKIAIEKSQYITSLVEAWRADVNPAPVEIPEEYAQWIDSEMAVYQPLPDDNADDVTPHDYSDVDVENSSKEDIDSSHNDEVEILVEDEYIAPFVEDDIVVVPPVEETEDNEENKDNDDNAIDDEPITQFIEDDVELHDEPMCDDSEEVACAEEFVDEILAETDDIQLMDDTIVVLNNEWDDDDDDDDLELDDDDDDDDDEGDNVESLLEDELDIDELYNRGEPLDNEPLTVGEMMSVRQAKEMRKALSLNDRFRFRRELFGNSDVNMNDTLNLIDTMRDYNEATDYLLGDLGWSIDEPVVQEFLQLVERHFKQ